MKNKVFISTSSFAKFSKEPLELLTKNNIEYKINPYGRKLKRDECLKEYKNIDGLIAGTESLDKDILDMFDKDFVISRVGVGTDNIDLKYAEYKGIKVLNTPLGPTQAVAELTIGLILDVMREISISNEELKNGNWKKRTGNLLRGKTVGVVGMGRIGKAVTMILKAFNVKVLCFDNYIDDTFMHLHSVKRVDFDTILKDSDVISIHLPYSDDLKYLFNKRSFEVMKKSAYLINASRGGIVNEEELYNALINNEIRGAAIDVFEQEPYEGKLRELRNVILTPHIGSATIESRVAMEVDAVKNWLYCMGLERT